MTLRYQPKLRYKLVKNRKHGINLLYQGYVYRRKVKFRSSTNWVCSRAPIRDASNKLVMCPGRCITNSDGSITVGRKQHNHPPTMDPNDEELDGDASPNEEYIFDELFVN